MFTKTLLVCLLLGSFRAENITLQPSIEVLIPKGMPIQIEPRREPSQPNIMKYVIKRIVEKDARLASIIAVMIDKEGKIKIIDPMVNDNLADPMVIATTDKSIARILIIVERLETRNGRWVADVKDGHLDIESLASKGAQALPCAKFFPRE